MRKTLAAAWIAMLPALASAQTPDSLISTHDVRALTRRVQMSWPGARLPLQAAFRQMMATRTWALPSSSVLEEHALSELLIGGAVTASNLGRLELVCDLQHQHLLPGPEGGFPLNAENVGSVDIPQIMATGGRFRTLLEPGRWAVVTMANGGGSPAALVVLARVRKP
jgi:hypothetical protein